MTQQFLQIGNPNSALAACLSLFNPRVLCRTQNWKRGTQRTLLKNENNSSLTSASEVTVCNILPESVCVNDLIDHVMADNPTSASDRILNNLLRQVRADSKPSVSIDFHKRTTTKASVQFTYGNFKLNLRPKSNLFEVQQRGFRTRTSKIGVGGGSEQNQNEPKRFWNFSNRLEEARKQAATSEMTAKNLQSTLDGLQSEAEKKTAKAAFTDGWMAKANETSTKGPDRSSLIYRFYFLLQIAVGILFVVYLFQAVKPFFSSTSEVAAEEIDVTFDDVKGVNDARDDLREIVNYLREPEKYSRLGARLPKGVLLYGGPGTGKTLLARAIAGEAGVPFFHASGSEFDEMLVGQGARRVRNLFDTAKTRAPCVIFIDEIDSVGGARSQSGLHPYANQTINQLLTEMDGFKKNEGVIVIGATNRRQDLDKALLRPGRFDIEVTIPPPDLKGRVDIYKLYLDKVICCPDVDLHSLAKRSVGFTGAQIENVVNQAALKAATDGVECCGQLQLEEAKDRAIMGAERKSGRPDDVECNRNTAYHEAGHALVNLFTKDAMPLHKCTILPRGQSLGHTAFTPDQDEYSTTRSKLLAQMDVAMGGRVAEELIFGADHVTTGASGDFKAATQIAVMMVKSFGMSDKIGVRDFSVKFAERELIGSDECSPAMAESIDAEIKRLLQESYERAKSILSKHSREHHKLAEALLVHETLDADQIRQVVIEGKELDKPTPPVINTQPPILQPIYNPRYPLKTHKTDITHTPTEKPKE